MSIERKDLNKCIGCRMCINICPMDVFRFDEEKKKSIIAYPENCAGCGQCWYFCPTDSLKMSLQSHMYPLTGMRAATAIDLNHFDCTAPGFRERTQGNPVTENLEEDAKKGLPVTEELPIKPVYDGEQKVEPEYNVDVLVIGGGFAGVNAAYMAHEAGKNVLLVDKGRPGFSGQSAWPGTFHFIDKEMGDEVEGYREKIRTETDGLANMDWLNVFIDESKETYERMKEWGVFDRFPRFCETEYWETNDAKGYRKNITGNNDRRLCFTKMMNKKKIPWLQHIMITKIIVQDGRCQGAVGFQTTTGKIVKINAKSVVMACGNGILGNGTFPMGGNSFDGEYMAYEMGLPIGGKEYEDFHAACSFASGNAWVNADTSYIDNIYLCGGWYSAPGENHATHNPPPWDPHGGLGYRDYYSEKETDASRCTVDRGVLQSKAYGKNPAEVRTGKYMSPRFHADGAGAAIGSCLHLASGIFCGLDDLTGYTGIPGLYCAGDGIQLTGPGGADYNLGNGSTSSFVSVCGARAGKSAAAFADTVESAEINDENFAAAVAETEAPLKVEKGYDANWARDVLMGIMAPYWVSKFKTEETLKAALVNVEYMRDNVADSLMARSPHDQRLCLEMKHKILSSELKLRASLERKESRGTGFEREDYPETSDEYKGFVLLSKGEDGKAVTSFVKAKPEWAEA